MTNIYPKYQAALQSVEGGLEITSEEVRRDFIGPIQNILKMANECNGNVARCCVERYKKDDQLMIKCSRYDLPADEFKKKCDECAAEIEKGLPKIIRQLS